MHVLIQLKDWKTTNNKGLQLVKVHPENVKLLYRLARANLKLRLFDKALGFIKRAVHLEPNNLQSIALKGEIVEAR